MSGWKPPMTNEEIAWVEGTLRLICPPGIWELWWGDREKKPAPNAEG